MTIIINMTYNKLLEFSKYVCVKHINAMYIYVYNEYKLIDREEERVCVCVCVYEKEMALT